KDHDGEPAAAGGADERWELPAGRTFPGTCRPSRAGSDSRRTWTVPQVQVRLVAVAEAAGEAGVERGRVVVHADELDGSSRKTGISASSTSAPSVHSAIPRSR